MAKKAISSVLCIIMLLCVLLGCSHQRMDTQTNQNGVCSVTTTVIIEKEVYKHLMSMGSDPFEGKSVSEYQHSGITYVSCAETWEYKSLEDMKNGLLNMVYETQLVEKLSNLKVEDAPVPKEGGDIGGAPDALVAKDKIQEESFAPNIPVEDTHIFSSVNIEKSSGIFYSSYTFVAVLNPQNGDSLNCDLNETLKVTLTVEMPTEITSSKGGAVEGNKIIFDIADSTESQELAATCEENNTNLVIGIVIGLVALVVGAVCLVKFKK